MIKITKIVSVAFLLFSLASCATGINSTQKRELSAYKAKGFYVEEKKVGLATGLGLLPGGGSFYTREYSLGVLNLLVWPWSVLWDPISGNKAATRINYYATKSNVDDMKKADLDELTDLLISDKISKKAYIIRKRDIDQRYNVSY